MYTGGSRGRLAGRLGIPWEPPGVEPRSTPPGSLPFVTSGPPRTRLAVSALAAFAVAQLLLAGCSRGTEVDQDGGRPAGAPASDGAPTRDVRSAAREVVQALGRKDFDALARWVHPEEGVLFAPYAYVEPDRHVTLSADQIRAVARGETLRRTWGHYDGTGEPIRLTFREYVERFVYDAPYLEEGRLAVDRRQGRGNTIDNAAAVWPEARIVEYHVPGRDPRYGGMDWRSLRLVFEPFEDRWRLVGIVHDQWTI